MTVPSFAKAGLSDGILLMSQVNGVSSRDTTVSPLRPFTVTGAISASNVAGLHGAQRAPHGLGGERILLRAREGVLRARWLRRSSP